jgi:hypothetical protein
MPRPKAEPPRDIVREAMAFAALLAIPAAGLFLTFLLGHAGSELSTLVRWSLGGFVIFVALLALVFLVKRWIAVR